jgi:hypothetical protein
VSHPLLTRRARRYKQLADRVRHDRRTRSDALSPPHGCCPIRSPAEIQSLPVQPAQSPADHPRTVTDLHHPLAVPTGSCAARPGSPSQPGHDHTSRTKRDWTFWRWPGCDRLWPRRDCHGSKKRDCRSGCDRASEMRWRGIPRRVLHPVELDTAVYIVTFLCCGTTNSTNSNNAIACEKDGGYLIPFPPLLCNLLAVERSAKVEIHYPSQQPLNHADSRCNTPRSNKLLNPFR